MSSLRRLVILLGVICVYLLTVSFLYQAGMQRLEAKPRTFLQALEWAADTFSTTGYGRDTHWSHPALVGLVIFVQFSGMLVVPLLIAIFVIPYLSQMFERRLPRAAPTTLHHHVIVYRFGPAVETLLQHLRGRNIPTLVAETDDTRARAALDAGQTVVFSRSDDDILDACRLPHARALVANGRDEENAALVLRARQMSFRGDIYAFVDDPTHRKPIELAGATSAYTPRHIIAAALAAHASDTLSPRLPGIDALAGIVRREVRIPLDSPAAGKSISAVGIGARTGAIVAGQWLASRMETRCTADLTIEGGSVLELVGEPDAVKDAAAIVGGVVLRASGPFLIAGFGEVGRKVHELLRDAGDAVRVIERQPLADVDVAGDVLDPSVLERAGVRDARAIVLALDSDDATLFATVIARDAAPDVAIIARVNHERNLANIHRAGADFALSIADISGEMLTSRLLGRTARPREERRRVARIPASRWTGSTVANLPLRANGCSAVAIDRRGRLLTRIDPSLVVEEGDALWICGTADAVHRVA